MLFGGSALALYFFGTRPYLGFKRPPAILNGRIVTIRLKYNGALHGGNNEVPPTHNQNDSHASSSSLALVGAASGGMGAGAAVVRSLGLVAARTGVFLIGALAGRAGLPAEGVGSEERWLTRLGEPV